ncbi:hypothetical protein MLD52_07600 [Puniceicoccaceae bacterium K14]|nr:hypothetical protein [Puniceicoccaceae bacterium K14]
MTSELALEASLGMTGTLTFTSYDEFEPDYKGLIIEQINELVASHLWWNQPLEFIDIPQEPELINGRTVMLRRVLEDGNGQQRNVDYRDDVIMSMVDYWKTIEFLTALSKEHEFIWIVGYPSGKDEKTIGEIVDGEIDAKIFDFLIQEMDALEISETDLQNQILHETIRSKYFASSGEPIFDAS